ncbi:MAG: hypothetical protein ACP5QA_15620 [Phycisphaerae bacterium]
MKVLTNLHKPLSDKNLAALGKKYCDLSVRYYLLVNRMMAMSQGHLLFSDHPKVKQSGPSIHKLIEQLVDAKWKRLLLARQGVITPPKTAKEQADMAARLHALAAKIDLLNWSITCVQRARYLQQSNKQKRDILDGANKLFQRAMAIPGKIGNATYGTLVNGGADILQIVVSNQGTFRIRGDVVDGKGRTLNGVKAVVTKETSIIVGPDKGRDAVRTSTQTINGHFDISASGIQRIYVKFEKPSLSPVTIGITYGDDKAIYDYKHDTISGRYLVKQHDHTWIFHIVLKQKPPVVTLINYPGQVSEDATGHGDAITLSTADRMKSQLTNVNLTKPNKLPPYTFYVTFKRDKKGRVMMTKFKSPRWRQTFDVPNKTVFHFTGRKAGLFPAWSSGLNQAHPWASKGPYHHRVVVTAKELQKRDWAGMQFYLKAGKKYGRAFIMLSIGSSDVASTKKNTTFTITGIHLHLQYKAYGTRYLDSGN